MSEYIKREDVEKMIEEQFDLDDNDLRYIKQMVIDKVASIDIDNWIPVSERLPEKNGDYIVSLEDSIYPWGRFFNGKWYMLPRDGVAVEFGANEVIAWQPLPEPYKGGDTK